MEEPERQEQKHKQNTQTQKNKTSRNTVGPVVRLIHRGEDHSLPHRVLPTHLAGRSGCGRSALHRRPRREEQAHLGKQASGGQMLTELEGQREEEEKEEGVM